MPAAVPAYINPDVLSWARRMSRQSEEALAKAASVPVNKYLSWESGERRPTFRQLESLSRKLKRPAALFYLPEPPADDSPDLKDFRRLPGVIGHESPELVARIRWARERRETALALFEDAGDEPPLFDVRARLDEAPDDVADRLRRRLGVSLEIQLENRDEYAALRLWVAASEVAGVLVLQASGVTVKEMRGFCLYATVLPVVVVNSSDKPRGRLFSLVHELVHLALGHSALSDLELVDEARPASAARTEVFCNRVAGAVLVPTAALDQIVRDRGLNAESADDVRTVASHFGVSREVVLRRLLLNGQVSRDFYGAQRKRLEEEYAVLRESEKERSGFAPPGTKAVSQSGRLLTRLAFQSLYADRITMTELSRVLGVKLKHMAKIEHTVMGQNHLFHTDA